MTAADPTPPSIALLDDDETEAQDDWSAPSAEPGWTDRYEPYSLLALVTAVLGIIPVTWPIPILSLAAVGLALVGLRQCQLHTTYPNRWMAILALFLGLLTLAAVVVLTSFKQVDLLPFWTKE